MLRPKSPKKVQVSCGACGHVQWEYEAAAGTSCRACGERIVMGAAASKKPAAKIRMKVERREIACCHCGHIMAVPAEAQSWQCPGCSSYLDLQDHVVAREHMTAIRTYGRVVVEAKGVAGGAKLECAGAEVAGRVAGHLASQGDVALRGEARLSGGAQGRTLEVEAGAKAEAGAGLDFDLVRVKGRLKARDIRTRRIEVADGGMLQAEQVRLATLKVEPGGWFEGRVETVEPEADEADAAGAEQTGPVD